MKSRHLTPSFFSSLSSVSFFAFCWFSMFQHQQHPIQLLRDMRREVACAKENNLLRVSNEYEERFCLRLTLAHLQCLTFRTYWRNPARPKTCDRHDPSTSKLHVLEGELVPNTTFFELTLKLGPLAPAQPLWVWRYFACLPINLRESGAGATVFHETSQGGLLTSSDAFTS